MPARLRLVLVAAFGVVVCSTAGCGGGKGSDQQQVRVALARFQTATSRHDYPALCKQILSRRLVERVTQAGLPCEVALKVGLGDVNQPQLKVDRVTIQGADALALVRSGAAGQPQSTDTVRLVKERGGWRVASLASAPQPSGTVLGPARPPKPKGNTDSRRHIGRR